MTDIDIFDRLQPIFRDVLQQPDLILARESSANTVEGWDSLSHVNLVWSVEHEFGVRFALGELQDLKNVGELVDLLQRKLEKKR